MTDLPQLPPLALYVHLPWCVKKCPYCDFNSHALKDALPEDAYVDALLRDLDQEARGAGTRRVETIFFGGGTPSLFSPGAIGRFLSGARERLAIAPGAEITLEANPGTVELERFRGFREAGVNRLSIGVQSLSAAQLQRLGRIHGRDEALRAGQAARAAGFDNFNLDLMFGLPEQGLDGALADLDEALRLAPTHLSHYQLTLEPNTLFHARPPRLPEDDAIWEMQLACQQRLAVSGYAQYEVSAYALPGRECRHNLNYWLFGDYLAVGAGAHGKLTDACGGISRYWKLKHPREYLAHAGSAAALGGQGPISVQELPLEFMMNALRLNDGFALDLFEARTGLPIDAIRSRLEQAAARDWLELGPDRVRPTDQGRLYLNELLELFVPE